jgi:hypothetical protein
MAARGARSSAPAGVASPCHPHPTRTVPDSHSRPLTCARSSIGGDSTNGEDGGLVKNVNSASVIGPLSPLQRR